jgi:hypothetical protein
MEDRYKAVKFLLEKGSNPHIPDAKGLDSCDYALDSPLFKRFSKVFSNCPFKMVELSQTFRKEDDPPTKMVVKAIHSTEGQIIIKRDGKISQGYNQELL